MQGAALNSCVPTKQQLIELRNEAIVKQQAADQAWLRVATKNIETGLCACASSLINLKYHCVYHEDDDEPDTDVRRRHRDLLEQWLKSSDLTYVYHGRHIDIVMDFLPDPNIAAGLRPALLDTVPQNVETPAPEKSFVETIQSIHEEAMATYKQENSQRTWTPEDDAWLEEAKAYVTKEFKKEAQTPIPSTSYITTLDDVTTQRGDRLMRWARTLGFQRCELSPSAFFNAQNKKMHLQCFL
jgi:hypothetical protein